jgi:hypothetical protein
VYPFFKASCFASPQSWFSLAGTEPPTLMAEMTRRQNEGSCDAVANGGHAAPGGTACNILSFPVF